MSTIVSDKFGGFWKELVMNHCKVSFWHSPEEAKENNENHESGYIKTPTAFRTRFFTETFHAWIWFCSVKNSKKYQKNNKFNQKEFVEDLEHWTAWVCNPEAGAVALIAPIKGMVRCPIVYFNCQLTVCMEQSPFWKANIRSISQDIPGLLWTRRFITVFTRACYWSLS
jgi:hypothetical protein